jgi:uncharacterized protein (TIGR02594 family)
MTLPDQYKWLLKEPGPKMLIESLNLYGIQEVQGNGNNPTIMQWAKELGIDWYTADSVPWCGLDAGIVALRAGHPFNKNLLLSALEWLHWGIEVSINQAMLGDMLIIKRLGGGHITMYVGEDTEAFHGLGGNQLDSHDIARVARNRVVGVRRPIYIQQPANVRKIILASTGALSQNEA